MEKQLLRRRMKGLLAVLLAFMMLCGTKMTTLAAELNTLQAGEIITDGEITFTAGLTSGNLKVVFVDRKLSDFTSPQYNGRVNVTVPLPPEYNYKVVDVGAPVTTSDGKELRTIKLECISNSSNTSAPAKEPEKVWVEEPAAVQSHEHDLSWVECYDATEETDGLMAYKCSNCGYIDSTAVIPSGLAYVRSFCAAIQNAPENGTIEWDAKGYRCYTKKMMEKLAGRPDVTLTTVYTEKDGTKKSFTIPAGEAPTEDDFYGFVYLGNLYGWN